MSAVAVNRQSDKTGKLGTLALALQGQETQCLSLPLSQGNFRVDFLNVAPAVREGNSSHPGCLKAEIF